MKKKETLKSSDLTKTETLGQKSLQKSDTRKSENAQEDVIKEDGDSCQTDDDLEVGKLKKVGQGFANLNEALQDEKKAEQEEEKQPVSLTSSSR